MFLTPYNLYEENAEPVAKQPARNMPLTLTHEGTLVAHNDDLYILASNDVERWQDKKKAA